MPQMNPHEKYMQAAQSEATAETTAAASPSGTTAQSLLGQENLIPEIPVNLEQLCQEHVCPNCAEKNEADQVRLRALAEMDNFKKRLAREHDEQLRYAAEKVLSDLLPTLDNLDLALQYGSKHEACKDMLMGVEMTRKLLLDALKQHGLEAMGAVGEPFTPEWHEALSFEMRPDLEEGMISQVMQRGYKLKERLLRPAKVSVSKRPIPEA